MEPELRPGDHLLYSGKSIFSFLIKLKTFSNISHVEIYIGDGKVITSRDGLGAQIYNFTPKNLIYVLRPVEPLNLKDGVSWFNTIVGQKYDWWGILRFFNMGVESYDRQFCSECCHRFDKKCNFFPFGNYVDSDRISPSMFLASPCFEKVWEAKG